MNKVRKRSTSTPPKQDIEPRGQSQTVVELGHQKSRTILILGNIRKRLKSDTTRADDSYPWTKTMMDFLTSPSMAFLSFFFHSASSSHCAISSSRLAPLSSCKLASLNASSLILTRANPRFNPGVVFLTCPKNLRGCFWRSAGERASRFVA
jgi:hypothetical protein